MECITQDTVDRTWQTIAEMDPKNAADAMYDFSEAQPHLLGFVMAFAEDLDTGASELCTYMLYVVYQMFVNSSSKTIPTITDSQVEAQYKATCELLDSLHDVEDDPSDEDIEMEVQNQPYVYRYVTEALLEEDDDPNDQMEVSEEEFGEIFMMMKTVIDAVDSATN